ncbi:MAG TPA: bifunctional diaminohydroxyphosphoribosylaminopyrimidine deaminase/5-amino-6-(5-phosphoribosylamino)uracil reductase RibD [Verrucomicrobiae bacterium]|nr:bifunctional diaminohydroxyphosphoribosylaminopyrimidine deaminase/5-amino-6-(5-phosphoribosylamino)uracil reductase RibD [Verrucomicrobiae bacterium]
MPDDRMIRLALDLARRGYGTTSPNPMVGAVLVKRGKIVGRGWHRQAGLPHAEIEALHDAQKHGRDTRGATLFVTLEPCSTHGRTPPCTEAIIAAGIRRVVIGTEDPNPKHQGRGVAILKSAGIEVVRSERTIAAECERLNEAFNHWIVRRMPFVIVKAAMTLDGKIATASGESRWITSEESREHAMELRRGVDAVLVGVNTVLADDPSLTFRQVQSSSASAELRRGKQFKVQSSKSLRRIVLDSLARTPVGSKIVNDEFAEWTTIVVSQEAPQKRVAVLAGRVNVLVAPAPDSRINLRWLLKKLGAENVTSLLVEGGGEVNASFLLGNFAQRVAFYFAPKILGGRDSKKAVAGEGAQRLRDIIGLRDVEWRGIGPDLFVTARIG